MLKFGNCLQKSEKNSIWLATIDDLEFPYFYPHFPAFTGSAINNFQKIPKI